MENIPRQKGFGCFSLKIGCVVTALVIILYSLLSLAKCSAALGELYPAVRSDNLESILTFGLVAVVEVIHAVTLFLTAFMLIGTLRDNPRMMQPWVVWTSMQVLGELMLFVFWTTMSMINHYGESSMLAYFFQFSTLLLRFYMLILVSSYYKKLLEERYESIKTLVDKEMWYNTA